MNTYRGHIDATSTWWEYKAGVIMYQSTSPGGLGSYNKWRQANNTAQGAYQPYMLWEWGKKEYQELGRL